METPLSTPTWWSMRAVPIRGPRNGYGSWGESPEEEIVDGHNGYSSRWYRQAGEQEWPREWWWKVLFLRMATPHQPYVIAFFPIENHRWLLSYIGVNKEYPPSREDQFTAALAKLASPVVHEMVRRMEPISPVYASRATRNRWRHYERWQNHWGNSSRLPTRPVRTIPDSARE